MGTANGDNETAAALAALGSATLGESGGRAADRRLRPAWPGAAVAAPAYPVGCTPGDNLAVHVAVTKAPRGSVLVVDVGRVPDRGYWGEVLTTAAEAAGLAGLVLDGGVRDVAALEAHGFPVFSSTIALTGATKDKPGTVGAPVRVGGVRVSAGDWVVADVDGVTFVPAGRWPTCWRRAGRARRRRPGSSRRCAPGRRRWSCSGSTRRSSARAGRRAARGRAPGLRCRVAARIAANAPGAVTGRRWPESIRTTSAGGGSRPAISSWVPGGTGRSRSFST